MARQFGVLYGVVGNTVTFSAVSIVNINIVLTINGENHTITVSTFGTGRISPDQAENTTFGFAGSKAVTLPKAFTRYPWSAVQGAVSLSGSVLTAPGPTDDFMLALTTCNQPGFSVGQSAFECLNYLRKTSRLPLVAILHCDDISYADNHFVAGGAIGQFDSQGRGIGQGTFLGTPGPQSAYDYAFNHASLFGVAGPVTSAAGDWTMWEMFHAPSFRGCVENAAFMPQWGDHEFANNVAWGTDITVGGNAYHKTPMGFDGDGLVTYNQAFASLQGTRARNADMVSNHWYVDFGPVRYVAPDVMTQARPAAHPSAQVLGAAQIDDIKDVIYTGKQHFTLIGWGTFAARHSNEIVATYADAYKTNNVFYQSEYDAIFRSTGLPKKSFMDHVKTNGTSGVLVNFRGDWHAGPCYYWSKPASAGFAAESFHEVGLATTSNSEQISVSFNGGDMTPIGCTLTGGTVKGTYPGGGKVFTLPEETKISVTVVEVYGSESPPRIVVKRYDRAQYIGTGDFVGESADMRNSFVEGPYDTFETESIIGRYEWGISFQRTFYPWSANGNKGYTRDEAPPHYPRGAIGSSGDS